MPRRPFALCGPLLVAAAVFAVRESTRPAHVEVAPSGQAVALPMLRTGALPRRRTTYRLDLPRSSVRFLVTDEGVEHTFDCGLAQGALVVGGADETASFDLLLDLASLRPAAVEADRADPMLVRQLLGVHSGEQVTFRGTLLARTTAPIPALQLLTWTGNLRFGGRHVRQTLQLWQTAVPGQPMRLQGHGPVPTATYGLHRHGWLGLFRKPHVVTLGLDLAWQRQPAD